jgi:hypothetical protein
MTAQRISRLYVFLNGVNDTAYFGFLTLQFLLLEPVLRALLPAGQSKMSIGLSMALITSQLLWQIFAEGPTGALADVYGRAWAVAVSFWCRLIAIVLVVSSVVLNLNTDSPAVARLAVAAALIVAQILMATGEAFLEGSIEAWLRDECEAASPEAYMRVVDKAFEASAVVQNVAILVTVTAVLVVWEALGVKGGIILCAVAACLCLTGAAVAQWVSARETFKGRADKNGDTARATVSRSQQAGRVVIVKLRDAFTNVVKADEASVRRLIVILVLPFPCWILLSWFFTALVKADGSGGAAELPTMFTLWLGITLGVARVAGALLGKRLSSRRDEKTLRSIFEKAVFVNVFFLSGAALLLVLRLLGEGSLPPSLGVALFLAAVALAKGSEEVIKLSKNKFLASALPNGDVRATTLSFVSVAQNAFGFIAISLSGLLAFMVTDSGEQQTVMIFTTCALFGITGWLIYRRAMPRVR